MSDFEEPRIGIHKVYTRAGDQGETALVGGQRVPKDDLRIEAYGTVDELNAVIGLCREEARAAGGLDDLEKVLMRAQHALFNVGSVLATLPEDVGPRQPRVGDADVQALEKDMDRRNRDLPALTSFVLPGGSRLNALLHLGRTVCRRAERVTVRLWSDRGSGAMEVRYLNRLSDALFVWARWSAKVLGHDEVLWRPDQAQGPD